MARLTISLLGPLQASLDGAPIADFATDKVRALLAYLVVEADRPQRRQALCGLLWPDSPEDKARQNLRQALTHLRHALSGDDEQAPFVLVSRETLQFNPASDYWLDVTAFQERVDASRGHRHRRREACRPCLRRLAQAAALYRGPFLEQFFLSDSAPFEEWAVLTRERLHRQVIDALTTLSQGLWEAGDGEQALHYTWRQVELEPWREEAHRELMRMLAASGQRSAALAQYEACRRALAEELGVEPTAETNALYDAIQLEGTTRRQGDKERGRQEKFTSPPCLPLSLSFVGREEELGELEELLANPDCRLITLVGPGGIGKSRLAVQSAAGQAGAFAQGIYFVSLEGLGFADLLVTAMAEATGLAFRSRGEPRAQLLDYVRQKELLLVLDGLEQTAEGSDLLAELLSQAPGVVLLVTARQRLGLQEEWVYQVTGLPYPSEAAPSLEAYAAVQLFYQRARQADRRFSSTADAPAVAHICRLVEGMPLAVELAAAWVAEHSCAAIAAQLEQNLDLLSSTLRNVPERQRSVRATFEHSWQLLSTAERGAFARLSVFCGGFDARAAAQAADVSAPLLDALADKSLLRRETSGRVQVHALLRQYAAEQLAEESQQQAALRAAHASYYTTILGQQESDLKGPRQQQALEEVARDIDNVRAAWQWAVEQLAGGPERTAALDALQRSAESLLLWVTARGWYQEGEALFGRAAAPLLAEPAGLPAQERFVAGWLLACQGRCIEFTAHADQADDLLTQSLALLEPFGERRERGVALQGLGYMAHLKGEYERAGQLLHESLAVYRAVGDLWGVGNVLNRLAEAASRQGAYEQARQSAQEGLAVRREIGDLRGIASSLNTLGLVRCALGEYTTARSELEEALQIARGLDYKVGIGNVLAALCNAAFYPGDLPAAREYAAQSLAVYREIGDYWGVAIALNNLGYLAMVAEELAEARALLQEAIDTGRQVGIKSGLANALGNLGEVHARLGDRAQARASLSQAVEVAQEIGAVPTILENVIRLAQWLAEEGDGTAALEWLAFALQHAALEQQARDKALALFDELAAALPPEVVTTAQARGRNFELEALVSQLLMDTITG